MAEAVAKYAMAMHFDCFSMQMAFADFNIYGESDAADPHHARREIEEPSEQKWTCRGMVLRSSTCNERRESDDDCNEQVVCAAQWTHTKLLVSRE